MLLLLKNKYENETIAIHGGYEENYDKSVAVPIHQTVAYEFDDAQHGADLFNPRAWQHLQPNHESHL